MLHNLVLIPNEECSSDRCLRLEPSFGGKWKMMKIPNYWQFSRKQPVSLLVIVTVLACLCNPLVPTKSLFAQQAESQAGDSSGGRSPEASGSVDADKAVPREIVALHIIREDYDGLGLSYPSKLFVDSVTKEIYVTDSGHSRILVYTYDFFPLLSIGKSDGVQAPVGLAVDPKGNLFVAQSPGKNHPRPRISVYNPALRWKKDIHFEGFEGAKDFHPTNVAINKAGVLYVTSNRYPGVVVLNHDGTFLHVLSPTDSLVRGEEQKATICDVEIDETGRIYLLSEDMGRVYVYDDNEKFLFKFGKKGGSTGKLSRPRGIGVDNRNKTIFVIDYMRHTASAYSFSGRYLFEFGGKGWGKGWFQFPSDINVDVSGNVLVADTFNNRVQVLAVRRASSVAKVEEVAPRVQATEPTAPPKVISYVLTANMNLREKSNTRSKIIRLMKKGEEFEIINQEKHDESTSWYQIETSSGLTGWFCGIYLGKYMFMERQLKGEGDGPHN